MNLLSQFVKYRCDGVLKRAGYYAYFEQLGILPGTKSCQSKTIIHVLELASNLAEDVGDTNCGEYSCQCGRFRRLEQKEELSRQLKLWDGATFGVCLDCLRSDGNTLVEKTCRAASHHYI